GLTIEWASSNEAIIAVDGKFVAPAEDTSVTLTATITLNEATATFSVSVLAKMIDSTPAANIFFSEYVEGSGYNKAMEIYNNEGVDVDLEGYTIEMFSNGSTEPSSYNPPIELTGILKAGETLVLIGSNDGADPILKEKADVVSGTINHNGDDFYVLKKGEQIVDSFGQFGVDPGDGYGTDPSTKDMTWVRKSSVTTGDTIIDDVFDPTVEWVATSKDDFTGLGSHTID
ncbi:MAG: lamin tail domain-containing protein, partial [Bacilli bacterium]|nr:lamin tail domain-containing protein [Bacilli bacterium]